MGAHPVLPLDGVIVAGLGRGTGGGVADDPVAAPFAEGARARAIVDYCIRASLPVFLIERTGQVVLTSPRAEALMGRDLQVVDGRLAGADAGATRRIRRMVDQAMDCPSDRCHTFDVRFERPDGTTLKLVALSYPNVSPYQFVKAVVLAGEPLQVAPLRDLLDSI